MRISRCVFGVLVAVGLIGSAAQAQPQMMGPLPAAPPGVPIITLEACQATGQLAVPVDKSQLLHTDQAFGELSVGNRDIADVQPLTRNLIYVLGKKRGTTNITISDQGGNIIAVVDVQVGFDIDALRRGLAELVPDERVAIRPAGDALILSGQVSSSDKLREILAVADRYAPNAITNMLSISGSQQVLLQVKFAEVQRSALRDINANFQLLYQNGGGTFLLNSGTGPAADRFGAIAGELISGKYDLQTSLDALEQKGALRTLAEPNLVALSGDTASFLAGGQIPVPVAQTGSFTAPLTAGIPVITVEFKDFGVSLGFTPTVIGKENVNLVINSEVSSIDPTLSVQTAGINVPGLKVRRAKTTIEMKDGQSFSIAGLLQDNFQDNISQLPILGNIPILGTLFRSTSYQQQQTELVVLITVHLVDPGIARNLADPRDSLVIPTPLQLFGNGKVEQGGAPKAGAGTDTSRGFVLP